MRGDVRQSLRAIELILKDWDPLGVISERQPGSKIEDEYDSYAPAIQSMLQHGCTVEELSGHLRRIREELMEIEGEPARDFAVAERLVRWWSSRGK